MYRPAESISIKGYIRTLQLTDAKEKREIPSPKMIRYVVKDPVGAKVSEGEVPYNKVFGSFDLVIKLVENINLGDSKVIFSCDIDSKKEEYTHEFKVQEVRSRGRITEEFNDTKLRFVS